VKGIFDQQIYLLDELLRVNLKETIYHPDMETFYKAIYSFCLAMSNSPTSAGILRKKCAEMKGIDFHFCLAF
jgi:hypothetical protein